jgi:hypothetical protein
MLQYLKFINKEQANIIVTPSKEKNETKISLFSVPINATFLYRNNNSLRIYGDFEKCLLMGFCCKFGRKTRSQDA